MEHFESFFFHVLLQLIVIIAAARAGAWIFGKLGQPQVVGEILAGLLLGPSLLGRFAPEWLDYLFPPDTTLVFHTLSEIGLVLLLFLIGLEFDFSHLRHTGRIAAGVAVAGIVAPFALGAGLAWWMQPHVAQEVDRAAFTLFVATALSITAIPVLGRIMLELNIHRSPLGVLTITAAAVDDALGWILLAAVSAVVRGGFDWLDTAVMLAASVGFVVACVLFVRPLVSLLVRRGGIVQDGELSLGGLTLVLAAVLLAALATNRIGIFSVFGPFVLGAALSHELELVEAVSRRLKQFVFVFFLPIFFTYTGLRTDVGSLDSAWLWLLCGLVLATAVIGKMAGCGLAARLGGLTWRESGCVAAMMNTRGLMGLIAINVGRELKVIPDSVFCMLVLMALATTMLTTPLLRRLLPTSSRRGLSRRR